MKIFTAFVIGLILAVGLFATHNSSPIQSLVPKSTSQGVGVSPVPGVNLSQSDLLKLASNKYADGNLPLGDKKYVTDAPKKGYIYLCNANGDPSGGGAQTAGSWIHGNTWNIKEKLSVSGQNTWPHQFTDSVSGNSRTLSGNDLPDHPTGTFPIQSTDPASRYDRNPNSIKAQSFNLNLPTNPTLQDQPSCIGGEVGVMLTGVALFDGFDAGLRDAAAWEVQDSCQGHPQNTGEYHYHSLSSCINDASISTVIGYALDGFPITGPEVGNGKYLTTDDLDVCHGITSEINLDGKKVNMYHYVMTEDFPYSVSCFRGKPVFRRVIPESGSHQQGGGAPSGQQGLNSQRGSQPPQEAYTACSGRSQGASCQVDTPNGTISGSCQTPPGLNSLVCVPAQR